MAGGVATLTAMPVAHSGSKKEGLRRTPVLPLLPLGVSGMLVQEETSMRKRNIF